MGNPNQGRTAKNLTVAHWNVSTKFVSNGQRYEHTNLEDDPDELRYTSTEVAARPKALTATVTSLVEVLKTPAPTELPSIGSRLKRSLKALGYAN